MPHQDNNAIRALLPKILKAVKKEIGSPDERRTINMLSDIGTSMQVEENRLLVSLFCDSYCQRDSQIHTRIVEDIFAPEFTESPRNVDYNYDFLKQDPSGSLWSADRINRHTIRTDRPININGTDCLINGGGIKSECTFYREHKTRSHEPFVPCETCHGSGRIKCTACGGSGRENMWMVTSLRAKNASRQGPVRNATAVVLFLARTVMDKEESRYLRRITRSKNMSTTSLHKKRVLPMPLRGWTAILHIVMRRMRRAIPI